MRIPSTYLNTRSHNQQFTSRWMVAVVEASDCLYKYHELAQYTLVTAVLIGLGYVWNRSHGYFFVGPRKNREPLTVVLDLDECLVCSRLERIPVEICALFETVKVTMIDENDGSKIDRTVLLRPGWREFLQICIDRSYNTDVFTASEENYARPVIDEIEAKLTSGSGKKVFRKCWFRNCCREEIRYKNHVFYSKSLGALGYNLQRTVLVDDDPTNFVEADNGIPIRPFTGEDQWDTSLVQVTNVLVKLEELSDVRTLLRQRFGLQAVKLESETNFTEKVDQWKSMYEAVSRFHL